MGGKKYNYILKLNLGLDVTVIIIGNPKGQAESWPYTGADMIYCHRCGYKISHMLKPEFWKLDQKEQTRDKLFDGEKWWKTEEDTPVGIAQIWYESGGGNNFSLYSNEEIEEFKKQFQKYFNHPDGCSFRKGRNILSEYRDGTFHEINLL
jgi:hypothetical protein